MPRHLHLAPQRFLYPPAQPRSRHDSGRAQPWLLHRPSRLQVVSALTPADAQRPTLLQLHLPFRPHYARNFWRAADLASSRNDPACHLRPGTWMSASHGGHGDKARPASLPETRDCTQSQRIWLRHFFASATAESESFFERWHSADPLRGDATLW